MFSAWSLTWLIIPIASLLLLGFIGWRIIKAIKKHKAKKQTPTVSQSSGKSKQHTKNKEFTKSKQKSKNKSSSKNNEKNSSKNNEKSTKQNVKPTQNVKTTQSVKPRYQEENAQSTTKTKRGLPRFDIQDAKMVAQDKENFVRHQELYFKHGKTKEEVKEFEQLNDYFSENYGHVPNQNLPADYTQKTSGFYCFNGNGSKNFKAYCESKPYNKEQDSGDRVIVQVDCGDNRPKLTFCINKDDQEMLNAAMKDIDSTVKSINATKASVSVATIEKGKFKVFPEKSYKEFCKADEKKSASSTKETPELSK